MEPQQNIEDQLALSAVNAAVDAWNHSSGLMLVRGLWEVYLEADSDCVNRQVHHCAKLMSHALCDSLFSGRELADHVSAEIADEARFDPFNVSPFKEKLDEIKQAFSAVQELVLVSSTQFEQLFDGVFETYTILRDAWSELRPRVIRLTPKLISSIKDINSEYVAWLSRHTDVLDRVAWEAFEQIVAEILASRGFTVDLTGRVRNRSADILAIRTDELGVETRYLIECKRFSRSRKVGLDIVNGVIGSCRRADADHALLVTSSSFSSEVKREEARLRESRIHLRDSGDVIRWLHEYTPNSTYGLWLPDGWNQELTKP